MKRELIHLGDRGRTRRIKLTVRSIAAKPVVVEVFAANPLWRGEGKLTFNKAPLTAKERGRYHRWKLTVKAKGKVTVTMDYLRAPPRRPKPVAQPRPRPKPRRRR